MENIKINRFIGMKLEESKRFRMEYLTVEVSYKNHEYDIHILPPRNYTFFPSEEMIEIYEKSGKLVRRTNPQNQIYKEIRDSLFSFDMSRSRTFFKKKLFDILYPHHLYDEMLMVEMNTDDMEIFLFGLGYKLIYTPVIKKSPYGGLYDDYISIHNGERLRVHYYVTGNFENMEDETVDCIPYKIEASTNEMYKLLYPYYQHNISDRYQIISDIDGFMLEHGFKKIGSKLYKEYASSRF